MDLNTLILNKCFCQKITDELYLIKLESLLQKENLKPFYEVINYMIQNKVRLEQESLYNL